MNSTRTLSAENRYSNKPFFRFTLQNNWQHFALYLIIILLAVVLPCVMLTNEYASRENYKYWDDVLTTCGGTSILVSIVIAVFSGMSAISYVNSKQMIGCYHSFPIRREGMFLIETSVRAIYYLVSFLFCSGLVMAIFNLNFPMTAHYNILYLKIILSSILIYLLLYSIVLFAGGLTGTAPVRLIMTLVILYLPIALYGIFLLNAYTGISQLLTEYYLSADVARVLCSTFRVAEAITHITGTKTPELFCRIFWCIPEMIVYYGGAFLLHKYRRSESSGTTIIWKPVFLFTKYIVIFAAALLGVSVFGTDMIFGSKTSGTVWMIFGLFFGAVLSSMLVNAILYRSSKAIFKNLRGLAGTIALAAVVMVVLPMDVFGLHEKYYDVSATQSIEIDDILYEDEAAIEQLIDLIRKNTVVTDPNNPVDTLYTDHSVYLWNDDPTQAQTLRNEFSYTIADSQEEAKPASEEIYRDNYDFSYRNYTYIDFIQKPKFGIPLAKRVYVDLNGEVWDTVARSDEYKSDRDRMSQVKIDDISYLQLQLGNFRTDVDLGEFNNHAQTEAPVVVREYAVETASSEMYIRYGREEVMAVRDILAELLPQLQYDPTKRDTGVIVGYIQFDIYSSREMSEYFYSASYPIYADDLEVLNGVARMINELCKNSLAYIPYPEFASADEYLNYFIDNSLRSVAIIDRETGEIREMPLDVFKEMADTMTYLLTRNYGRFDRSMRVFDGRYWIVGSFGDPEFFADSRDTRVLWVRSDTLTDTDLSEYFNRSK